MTLLLQGMTQETQDKAKNADDLVIDDDLVISAPVKCEQTLHVRFNFELNMFEGLPKEWREVLELPP